MIEVLARSLMNGVGVDHSCHDPRLVETHISWLVLLGDYAYKLKKPLDLGFLNFSTLPRRKFFCEEEVRLNRRTAPDIYLDVLAVSGDEHAPRLGDDSDPFEYVVRMRRFDDSTLLNKMAANGLLDESIVLGLARTIADFHTTLAEPASNPAFATPAVIKVPVEDNFRTLDEFVTSPAEQRLLARLADWSRRQHGLKERDFQFRHDGGFVRECHGDLHLANIVYRDGQCTLFDCIEFSDALRWIDVAADIAFTIMDIESYDYPLLAHLLLNEYLQHTGDYGALAVLDYYIVYRSVVRAKVCGIRANQDTDHAGQLRHDCNHYLEMANKFTRRPEPFLVMMSGLSGTGKTWLARRLGAHLSAIHIRSDVERKRLYRVGITEPSGALGLNIYTPEANARTFDTIEHLARSVTDYGYPVMLDATFIEHELRLRFGRLAEGLGIPWAIISCTAPESVVRQRLASRTGDASEAGYAQYLDQELRREAFVGDETRHVVEVDTASKQAVDALPDSLMALLRKQN